MSKIRGYNNDSGMIYTQFNGLQQYSTTHPMFPINKQDQDYYVNPNNVKIMLETMNDEEPDETVSRFKIPEFENGDLADGGFVNRVNTKPQVEPIRLTIKSDIKKLVSGNIGDLPLSEGPKEDNPFKKFISRLK
jgi:hypothetical protein